MNKRALIANWDSCRTHIATSEGPWIGCSGATPTYDELQEGDDEFAG